jgi:hypothetical protein
VAEHDALEVMARACCALDNEPDNQGLRRTDTTSCGCGIVDRSGLLECPAHARPDVMERWSRRKSPARRGGAGEVGEDRPV